MWWNERVEDKLKEKNRRFRLWMKKRTPETRTSYVAAMNEIERVKMESKKESWNSLCEHLEEDVICIMTLKRRKARKTIQHNIMIEGEEIITYLDEIKEHWMEYFTALLNIPTDNEQEQIRNRVVVEHSYEITKAEVQVVILRPGCNVYFSL